MPPRTRIVPVIETPKEIVEKSEPQLGEQGTLQKVIHPQQPASYELNVETPHAPHEVLAKLGKTGKSSQSGEETKSPTRREISQPKPLSAKKQVSRRIWNALEWLATSALIFAIIFFIINYQAYSTLLVSRLNEVRGQVQSNPYVQNLTHPASVTQQPLPITATPDQSKKQIPYFDMEIAPPDDRVVISRINRNVPIVKVSSENLIKRNWSGLESDIQQALRYGVVHYPGTAEPGENGNVVITGHSSYFSWDPGRFKDVFALLHDVVIGDKIVVYHNQKKYFYQVYDKFIVTPDQINLLTQNGENRLTLITCTPVGTNLKRLIVLAHPIQT